MYIVEIRFICNHQFSEPRIKTSMWKENGLQLIF